MFDVTLGVSEALGLINETLDAAYPFIIIEGEVAGFTLSKQKFVFFDIKDEAASLSCFMMVFQLKFPLEEGMKVRLVAQPKLTAWGKFSLTVREVMPVGEGALKKSFELLKAKLQNEGLFDAGRKRSLPAFPTRIGVVSSAQAAGFADFIKILENRWSGLHIVLVDVNVQGLEAPTQIIQAIGQLNELSDPVDVLAIIRGGGSADDLSAFNHEGVVRAISTSRTPTIVGVGHEIDTSLSDLAADVRAATPSNAAQLIVPEKAHILQRTSQTIERIEQRTSQIIDETAYLAEENVRNIYGRIEAFLTQQTDLLRGTKRTLQQLNPEAILKRGYSIVKKGSTIVRQTSDVILGDTITITVRDGTITGEVTNAHE